MSKRACQSEHEAMLVSLAEYCLEEGFSEVCLDLPMAGYGQPFRLMLADSDLYETPDVTAVCDGVTYLFEVETEDSVMDEHTVAQWRILAQYAAEHNGRLVIAVPRAAEGQAWQRLAELAIQGAEVWAMDY